MPITRWNDDRLDGLALEVSRMTPLLTDMAVMKTEFANLTRELRANTKATEHVASRMEASQLEPLKRGEKWRSQLGIVLFGALAGGSLAILGAVLGSVLR